MVSVWVMFLLVGQDWFLSGKPHIMNVIEQVIGCYKMTGIITIALLHLDNQLSSTCTVMNYLWWYSTRVSFCC